MQTNPSRTSPACRSVQPARLSPLNYAQGYTPGRSVHQLSKWRIRSVFRTFFRDLGVESRRFAPEGRRGGEGFPCHANERHGYPFHRLGSRARGARPSWTADEPDWGFWMVDLGHLEIH
jgi:hypothetical protein